jgi:DNA-binding response OmpR family regulator
MTRVAVIEDDLPTSNQLAGWIRAARPQVQVDQWFDRDSAEAALARENYDVVVLDIELGRERHAGVALINAINKRRAGVPVLVVSAMPAAIYRSIMKALDAWDYLQKTTFEEADFVETFLEILRVARERRASDDAPKAQADALSLDPLWQRTPTWRGQRINLPLTAQRILADAVSAARRSGVLRGAVRRGQERPQPRQRAQARGHHPRCPARGRPGLRGHRERADARLPLGRRQARARMKLPELGLPGLEAPRLGLASFRRRILFRAVFLLLALATLALAVVLLQDEKQRSYANYQQAFRRTQADLLARLRDPAASSP